MPLIIGKILLSLLIFVIVEFLLLFSGLDDKTALFFLSGIFFVIGIVYGFISGNFKKVLDFYISMVKGVPVFVRENTAGIMRIVYTAFIPVIWLCYTMFFIGFVICYCLLIGPFYAPGHFVIAGIKRLSGKK